MAFGLEALELGSCYELAARGPPAEAAPRQAAVLRHGFVHLCSSDEDTSAAQAAHAQRSRSCGPWLGAAAAAEAEELAFARYVATFHFLGRPGGTGPPVARKRGHRRAPSGTRRALAELAAWGPSGRRLPRARWADEVDLWCGGSLEDDDLEGFEPALPRLRADAPAFVPQAVALSTTPSERWPPATAFSRGPGVTAEAGARVPPPPPLSPPAMAGLLATLCSPGPPPAPAGDPWVSAAVPQQTAKAATSGLLWEKVTLDDHLELLAQISHASSTTAPPSVSGEDAAS